MNSQFVRQSDNFRRSLLHQPGEHYSSFKSFYVIKNNFYVEFSNMFCYIIQDEESFRKTFKMTGKARNNMLLLINREVHTSK